MLNSCLCRAEQFRSAWFNRWANAFNAGNARNGLMHRKEWEWAAIAQALDERGVLGPGYTGVGFAVGNEPLSSLFAARGAKILATDLTEGQDAEHWKKNEQLAGGLDAAFQEHLISRELFLERVAFQHGDMNDLSGFDDQIADFIWSSCAMEHLGTIEAGLRFVKDSVRLLKPGGIAAHTTEFNLSHIEETVSEGLQVFYRESDLRQLDFDLRRNYCCLEPLDLFPGTEPADVLYDPPPFYSSGHHHIKLILDNYLTTSVLLIVRKFR